jgi:Kef-type K+ transport system membrane component KefB
MQFSDIAILLVAAGSFGIIAKMLKQPLLVGYIFAGVFIAGMGFINPHSGINSLGQIGVSLLLFLLGVEMKLSDLSSLGKTAILNGLGQITLTFFAGLLILFLLGVGIIPSIYIAIALTFSSTIVMVKLLSEKKDLSSLYGKISISTLLVQDVVAIAILIFLGGFMNGENPTTYYYLFLIAKALILFAFVWIASQKLLPFFFGKFVSSSPELLFIVSVSWALGFSYFVAGPLGLSLEIGGFLAGIAISNLPEHMQVVAKTRPLRDFFLAIFFVFLGTKLAVGGDFTSIIFPAIILSMFVLVVDPIIAMFILGLLGYKKRTSFMSALTVSQISEFSLILVTLGETIGHLDSKYVSLVVLVGVITMTVSTYFILDAEKIYQKIHKYLDIFERKVVKEKVVQVDSKMEKHIVLVGCDRAGRQLVKYFLFKKIPFLVVDFNPSVVTKLTAMKVPVVFGDINDEDIIEASNLEKASLLVSTISNLPDNMNLLSVINKMENKPLTLFTSLTKKDAIALYEAKANYVVVPEVLAGEHIRQLVGHFGYKGNKLSTAGKNHFKRLMYI